MRVAALAFGVLAGLVASLILALGGLDVTDDMAALGERQVQAIRFGLLVIGNLGIFGAALTLAAPLAGAIFLIVGALAWVGAALLTHHTTDFVLITPPALLAVGAVLAMIAHLRRPRPVEADDAEEGDDVEIISPQRPRPSEMMSPDEEVGMPAFAAEAPSTSRVFVDERLPSPDEEWNPRRRQPPPPRTKPAFRAVDEDEYEDDEPSGFSRFALGLSGVLSFGLYAALAVGAVLVFWNWRNMVDEPAAVVAEVPAASASSSAPPVAPPPSLPPAPSSEPEPVRLAAAPEPPPPAETPPPAADVTMSAPPPVSPAFRLPIPVLPDDFMSEPGDEPSAPPETTEPPAAAVAAAETAPEPAPEPAAAPEPAPVEPPPAEPPAAASVPGPGQPMPHPMPPAVAAQRTGPSPGVTTVAMPAAPSNLNNTGL